MKRHLDTHEEGYMDQKSDGEDVEPILVAFLGWLYKEKEFALCKEHPFGYVPEQELDGGALIQEFTQWLDEEKKEGQDDGEQGSGESP